jgi:hypothetical protein
MTTSIIQRRKIVPGRDRKPAWRVFCGVAGLLLLGACGDFTLFPEDQILPEVVLTADPTSTAVCEKEVVNVDGSGSTDPEGGALTYAWTMVVPSGSQADFADPDAASTTFSPDRSGEYVVTLTVITERETSATSSVTVVATSDPTADPTAVAQADDTSVTVNTPVNLDGTGSKNPLEADCGSSGLTFAWAFTEKPPTSTTAKISPADDPEPSFTPDVAGLYKATLTVTQDIATDPKSSSATVTVTATAAAEGG